MSYDAPNSATKERDFLREELSKQAQAGHISLSTLREIYHLTRLWTAPLSDIPQQGRKLRLIYDFSWIVLNKEVIHVAPKETISFGKALYRLIDCIILTPMKIGPDFLSKVDLSNAYMRIWVHPEDIPPVPFLVQTLLECIEQLSEHLAISLKIQFDVSRYYSFSLKSSPLL